MKKLSRVTANEVRHFVEQVELDEYSSSIPSIAPPKSEHRGGQD